MEGSRTDVMGKIVGVGGANLDMHCQSERPLIMRDSNPGRLHMSPGGVCRNICENLARLGLPVSLVTAVGDDAAGQIILESCRTAGVDTSAIRVVPGASSTSYVSMMDESGDMLMAMSDMKLIRDLKEDFIDGALDTIQSADRIVCDGNLPLCVVRYLAEKVSVPLYLDPVSTSWARALAPCIGAFDTVKPNRMELEALTNLPCDTLPHITMAAAALRESGVRRVFVSLGEKGMLYCGPEGTMTAASRPFDRMVNATGAGDAAMAGIIYADETGMSMKETVWTAMAAGLVAIASENTINARMTPQIIEDMIKEYIL